MKFVLVGPVYPYRGGIAHYTTMLARTLAKRCSQLHVVSFCRQYPRWLYPGKSDRDPSQEPLRVNAEYLLDPFYPWTWWQTARRIAEWKPDVVILQWWTTFWAPAFWVVAYLLRRKRFPIVFLIHNVLPHEVRFWDAGLASLVLRQAQAFIVQTGHEESRLLSLYPRALVRVCPHPVYDMFVAQRVPKEEAKRRLGLPQDMPLVLFFGIVRQYKGLKYLIDALALLRDWGRPFPLVVAGEFWEDESVYLRQIERLSLQSQVRLENRYIPDDQVSLFFSAADVFVAPYVGGTQSGTVKMAMGFGVPIVVTEKVAEGLASRGPQIRVVAAGDAMALASEIRDLIDNDKEHTVSPERNIHESWEELADSIESIVARGRYPK